jgi:hypothetical protein
MTMDLFGSERSMPPVPKLPAELSSLQTWLERVFDGQNAKPVKHGELHADYPTSTFHDPLPIGGAPLTVVAGGAAHVGSGPGYMLSDAQIVVGVAAPQTIGVANIEGVAVTVSRSDHVHASGLTAKGDIFTHSGAANARLPVGADGDLLSALASAGTGLFWQSLSAKLAAAPYSFGTQGQILGHDGTTPVGIDGSSDFNRKLISWPSYPGKAFFQQDWLSRQLYATAGSTPALALATPYTLLENPGIAVGEAGCLTLKYLAQCYTDGEVHLEMGTVDLLVYRLSAGGACVVLRDPATTKVAATNFAPLGETFTVDFSVVVPGDGSCQLQVELNSDGVNASPLIMFNVDELDWTWGWTMPFQME